MQLLPLAAYSPDMSPIEHVWYLVGRRPRHSASKRRNFAAHANMWNSLPLADIQNLFDSMPRRIVALIAARSGYLFDPPTYLSCHQLRRACLRRLRQKESLFGPVVEIFFSVLLLFATCRRMHRCPPSREESCFLFDLLDKKLRGGCFSQLITGIVIHLQYKSLSWHYFQDDDRFNSCQVIYSQFGLTIHQNDHQAMRRFVEWAQNEIAVVPDFNKRILFSDEAHFWLNSYVNKQNCRIWSEANPQVAKIVPVTKNLLAPDIPSDQTLDKLKDALKKHLTPKPLIIPSRHKFLNRKQTEGEGKYKDIFDDKLGEINNYEAKLKLRHGVKPIFCRVRTVPFALKGRVENEIDRLEKEGIIEKSTALNGQPQ
ncbi:retrovirus-related Pol polyprotein from transposon 412 [Trichonephila clavipes]|nr:retrovirus-related Pol polyprotein from transposon 412 [Trichonephila clavipes]